MTRWKRTVRRWSVPVLALSLAMAGSYLVEPGDGLRRHIGERPTSVHAYRLKG